MPLNNGKLSTVSKPSWLKDTPASSATSSSSSASPSPTTRTWQRKASTDAKKEDSPVVAEPASRIVAPKVIKKELEPKKEVTAKLQSREIKVPLKVEKTIPPPSILKKPEPKVVKEPEVKALVADKKLPPKFGSKSPSTTPSKSTPSTTPSKSPTPSKTPESFDESDEDEEEEEEEEETESESETESKSEDEIDSDEFDFSDNEPYRPPSPVNSKQKLIIPALRKVKKAPEPEQEKRRSKSPEFTFKKPELKKVVTKEPTIVRERSPSPEPKFLKQKLRKVPSSLRSKNLPPREKIPIVELKKAPSKQMEVEAKKISEVSLKPAILRAESTKKSEFEIIFLRHFRHWR